MSSDFSIKFNDLCARGLIESITPDHVICGDEGWDVLLVKFKDYEYTRNCDLVANSEGEVDLILSAGGQFRTWFCDYLNQHNVPFNMH